MEDESPDSCAMSLLSAEQQSRIIDDEGPDVMHCNCWYDTCERPCCRCGDNTKDEDCDCEPEHPDQADPYVRHQGAEQ